MRSALPRLSPYLWRGRTVQPSGRRRKKLPVQPLPLRSCRSEFSARFQIPVGRNGRKAGRRLSRLWLASKPSTPRRWANEFPWVVAREKYVPSQFPIPGEMLVRAHSEESSLVERNRLANNSKNREMIKTQGVRRSPQPQPRPYIRSKTIFQKKKKSCAQANNSRKTG